MKDHSNYSQQTVLEVKGEPLDVRRDEDGDGGGREDEGRGVGTELAAADGGHRRARNDGAEGDRRARSGCVREAHRDAETLERVQRCGDAEHLQHSREAVPKGCRFEGRKGEVGKQCVVNKDSNKQTGDDRKGARLGAEGVVVVHEERGAGDIATGARRNRTHHCDNQTQHHRQPTLTHSHTKNTQRFEKRFLRN